MNYITHLTAFFERASVDTRLSATHISMYMSLFQFWNFNRFKNPISISRSEIMKISKISAIATYHKCIKELNAFGYIIYEPSFNPFKGSMVKMLDFEKEMKSTSEKHKMVYMASEVLNKQGVSVVLKNEQAIDDFQTSTEQVLVPYINNNKHTKHNKPYCLNVPQAILKFEQVKVSDNQKRKVAPKEKVMYSQSSKTTIPGEAKSFSKSPISPNFKIPHISEVKLFFEEKDAPLEEAEKFYNHYESNGWLVGGKSKMKNWQAAARNWLLNSKRFYTTSVISKITANSKTNHLHATKGKSYQDPL